MIEGLVEEENKPKPKFKVGDRVITNKGYIGKFEGWVSDYQVRVLFEESGCNVVIHPKDLKLAEEETKPNVIEEAKTYWDSIKDAWICPEGYQFVDENGNVINATKIVLEKKKKEYPKTYEECCKALDFCGDYTLTTYDADCTGKKEVYGILQQVNSLTRLLICRSAYWKIAGEEMGLGKPWEPDWEDVKSRKYAIVAGERGKIIKGDTTSYACAFAFPTPEMRDVFKENFDPDIEICKEFL